MPATCDLAEGGAEARQRIVPVGTTDDELADE